MIHCGKFVHKIHLHTGRAASGLAKRSLLAAHSVSTKMQRLKLHSKFRERTGCDSKFLLLKVPVTHHCALGLEFHIYADPNEDIVHQLHHTSRKSQRYPLRSRRGIEAQGIHQHGVRTLSLLGSSKSRRGCVYVLSAEIDFRRCVDYKNANRSQIRSHFPDYSVVLPNHALFASVKDR